MWILSLSWIYNVLVHFLCVVIGCFSTTFLSQRRCIFAFWILRKRVGIVVVGLPRRGVRGGLPRELALDCVVDFDFVDEYCDRFVLGLFENGGQGARPTEHDRVGDSCIFHAYLR